jgi:YD repeat-containing protein
VYILNGMVERLAVHWLGAVALIVSMISGSGCGGSPITAPSQPESPELEAAAETCCPPATSCSCDDRGNILTMMWPWDFDDEEVAEVWFAYDASGNRVTEESVMGNYPPSVMTLRYDASGNLVARESDWGGDGVVDSSKVWSYDEAGRLISCTDNRSDGHSRRYAWTYTEQGHPLRQVSESSLFGPSEDWSFNYRYDAEGNLLSLSDSSGRQWYGGDEAGNQERSRPGPVFTYDASGRVIEERRHNRYGDDIITYRYDAQGNLIVREGIGLVPNGLFSYWDQGPGDSEYYAYDTGGRRTQYEVLGREGAVVYREDYRYDRAGNWVRTDRYDAYQGTGRDFSQSALTSYITYTYDARGNRVAGEGWEGEPASPGHPGWRVRWTYDAVGNRLTQETFDFVFQNSCAPDRICIYQHCPRDLWRNDWLHEACPELTCFWANGGP